jgi:hypothetical protein
MNFGPRRDALIARDAQWIVNTARANVGPAWIEGDVGGIAPLPEQPAKDATASMATGHAEPE